MNLGETLKVNSNTPIHASPIFRVLCHHLFSLNESGYAEPQRFDLYSRRQKTDSMYRTDVTAGTMSFQHVFQTRKPASRCFQPFNPFCAHCVEKAKGLEKAQRKGSLPEGRRISCSLKFRTWWLFLVKQLKPRKRRRFHNDWCS
jgi:hypothetical protein